MSMTSFIPELVLAALVLLARKRLVAMQFCNTAIGIGLKEKGNKVKINTLGDVSVADTDEDEPMTYGDASTSSVDLEIEIDKTIAVRLKDSERAQIEASGDTVENALGQRIVYALNNEVDELVMTKHSQATDFYETGTTSWQWGTAAADVPEFFAALHKAHDDVDNEDEGRFVVLPNIAIQGIRLYLAERGTALGDEAVKGPGMVVRDLFGFAVFRSPNCVNDGTILHGLSGILPNVGEGVPGVIAAAVQISPVIEKLRLQGYWADGIRARVTAGARVFRATRSFDINLNPSLLA